MLDKLKLTVAGPAAGHGLRNLRSRHRRRPHRRACRVGFPPLKPGTLSVSPLKENVLDPDEFVMAVRSLSGTQATRKRRDVALILPDFSARISVLDFDSFPKDAQGAGLRSSASASSAACPSTWNPPP